jgi:uncharacterized membrane protein YccC
VWETRLNLTRHIDVFTLKRAARAAIVMPANFAFADLVIGNSDTTLFAAFGSFAILVMADFGGPRRVRLVAYLSLAVAGAVLITLGTLCSQTPWLAVAAIAVVGFAVLFSRLISGYFASAGFAPLLLFIIPVSFPGPPSAIPDRLLGWGLAAVVGIGAAMLLWPARPFDKLRAGAARACRALADLVDPTLRRDASEVAARAEAASSVVAELRREFVATPYRPTAPTGPTEALAFLVDALEWLRPVATAAASDPESGKDPCREENYEINTAAAAVLRAGAANLDGRTEELPLGQLEQATEAVEGALARRLGGFVPARDALALSEATQSSFRTRELSLFVREIGLNARRAAGQRAKVRLRETARATRALLLAHASPSSASFRNSLRGAAGLTLAVLVIQVASVQHGFWVALAALLVLRSNALGTGATIASALAGTIAGIVVGGILIYAVGTEEAVLWALLPPAVLLAAYAPQAISFSAGQAGFTVVVLIIFNIIVPTGWELGLVRVEDVAIGSAISLAVGLLLWPRGLESLVRQSVGAAYARAADYAASAARRIAGAGGPESAAAAVRSAREAARAAAARLDDAVRQYRAESGAQGAHLDKVAALVAGATRVRLIAYSLATLAPARSEPPLDRCGQVLTLEADSVRRWYQAFADALIDGRAAAPPRLEGDEAGGSLTRCVSESIVAGGASPSSALGLVWAAEHFDSLRRLGAELGRPAVDL